MHFAPVSVFWAATPPRAAYEPHPSHPRCRTRVRQDVHRMWPRGRESRRELSGVRSSSLYGDDAASQLEMEEECPNAARSADQRAGLRVVRPPAGPDAASRLVERSVGPSSQAGRAVSSLPCYRQ